MMNTARQELGIPIHVLDVAECSDKILEETSPMRCFYVWSGVSISMHTMANQNYVVYDLVLYIRKIQFDTISKQLCFHFFGNFMKFMNESKRPLHDISWSTLWIFQEYVDRPDMLPNLVSEIFRSGRRVRRRSKQRIYPFWDQNALEKAANTL